MVGGAALALKAWKQPRTGAIDVQGVEDGHMAKLDPEIADEVPWADEITSYDKDHFITYLRLLEAEGADWREVAHIVLDRDPDTEPDRSRRCWEEHLKRARWMTEHGYRHLLDAVRSE